MKQTPEDEDFTPEPEQVVIGDDEMPELDRGAEPFWMQDIRLAQRSIEAERARLRAAQTPGPSE